MKFTLKNKLIFSALFLLFSNPSAKAQGTEAALAGLAVFGFIVLGLALLAITLLIIFIVNRNKIIGIVSAIFGFFLLLGGVGISLLTGSYGDSIFESLSDGLKLSGALNLLLVFVFSKVFPKEARIETQDDDPDPDIDLDVKEEPDRSGEPVIKWLSLVLGLWFFYNLNSSFQYLQYTSLFSSDYESSISAIDLYFLLLQLLPLLLLLVCVVLFVSRKRAGWTLLLFYSVYTLAGFIVYIVRNNIFKSASHAAIPIHFQLIQISIILFFGATVWLILRPNIRMLFSVDKKSSLVALVVCVSIAAALLLVSNFLLPN